MVVVGLPAHASHVLQPLDVPLFGPFQSFPSVKCMSLHGYDSLAMSKKVLDAFDVADIIRYAISDALIVSP